MHVQLGQIIDKIQKDQTEKKTQLPLLMGFPDSSVGKGSPCNVGNLGSIPWLGRSPGEGKGYPLQYSGLENSMGCIVHGVAKNWTRPSDFHSLVHSHFWRPRSKKRVLGNKSSILHIPSAYTTTNGEGKPPFYTSPTPGLTLILTPHKEPACPP